MHAKLPIVAAAVIAASLTACASTGQDAPSALADADAPAAEVRQYSATQQITGTRLRLYTRDDDRRLPLTSFPLTIHGDDEVDSTGTRDMEEVLRLISPIVD